MNDLKGIIEDCNKSDLVSDKVIKKIIEIIGQEKWQDINDEESDICTTTGELIIILKGTADLEKENTKIKTDYEVLSCSVGDFGELQDKLEEEQRKNNELSDNLAKAKEILKMIVNYYPCYNKTIAEQAEQFLKSEDIILEDAQAGNSPFDADEVFNKEMKAYSEEKEIKNEKEEKV